MYVLVLKLDILNSNYGLSKLAARHRYMYTNVNIHTWIGDSG